MRTQARARTSQAPANGRAEPLHQPAWRDSGSAQTKQVTLEGKWSACRGKEFDAAQLIAPNPTVY